MTVKSLIPRLPQITSVLINPPYKPPVHTTCGVLKVPLGKTRLSLAKLVSALLSINHAPLNPALSQANTVTVLLDLFFEYSLNNLLHAQVESCVHSILFWKDVTQDSDGNKQPLEDKLYTNPALVHLLSNAQLLDRLISTWTNTNLPPSVSYMGHVTRISNDLVIACRSDTIPLCQSRTLLLQLLSELPEETKASWGTITTGILADRNKMNEVKSSEADKGYSDFRDIQSPNQLAMLQVSIV